MVLCYLLELLQALVNLGLPSLQETPDREGKTANNIFIVERG